MILAILPLGSMLDSGTTELLIQLLWTMVALTAGVASLVAGRYPTFRGGLLLKIAIALVLLLAVESVWPIVIACLVAAILCVIEISHLRVEESHSGPFG